MDKKSAAPSSRTQDAADRQDTGDRQGVYVSLKELISLQPLARGFSFLPRQPVHSILAGQHASRLRGRGLNFEEIRRYQIGDDIRQIDWKVTARTRKTHSRVYTEERERTTLLLVDQRINMFFGSVKNMKSVTAAQAAAIAAWRVLAQKDRVGSLVFNDRSVDEIRPQRSRSTVMRILQKIKEQNHSLSISADITPNPSMLNDVLLRCDRLAKHDCLVCIISDGTGQDEQTRQLLTRIAHHNDVLFVFVHDPLESELPVAGPLVFGHAGQQVEVNTSDRGLRERFRSCFAQQRAAGKKFLLQRETPVIPLSTAEDVAEQIRRQLGARNR